MRSRGQDDWEGWGAASALDPAAGDPAPPATGRPSPMPHSTVDAGSLNAKGLLRHDRISIHHETDVWVLGGGSPGVPEAVVIWSKAGFGRIRARIFIDDDHLPGENDRTLVCGRCFSATHDAHGSSRSMAQTMAMGHACGTAAAISLADDAALSANFPTRVHETRRRRGAVLEMPETPADIRADGWARNRHQPKHS